MGKLRESLTLSSEVYMKQVLNYLSGRHYYLKAGADVEATLADAILTRKGETREYWLEVKETAVSLGDSSFLSQLAKYLAEYLSRTAENRFRMILACYRIVNAPLFESVYNRLELEAISTLVEKMREVAEPNARAVLMDASSEDTKKFFEETIVIEASLKDLEIAQEKIKPTPPAQPSLPEAEYATKIMAEFGDISPLRGSDKIYLNLFCLEVPGRIYVGETLYRRADDIFSESPGISFPIFDLTGSRIYSFDDYKEGNPLSSFIIPDSVTSIDLATFITTRDNEQIIKKILNRWIRRRCRRAGLESDPRSGAYYYPRSDEGDGCVTARWKPRLKHSVRELTKPMENEGRINFWVHRGAVVSAKNFWGRYYVQIRPRFLFSSDGMNLLEGEKADKLDRNFRKSIYGRNLNRMYDVLFWYRHIFPETENLGTASLVTCLGFETKQSIRILEQINVESECRPNIDVAEEVEEFDKIDSIVSQVRTLEDYMSE
jgi:hypothetical protein